MNQSVLRVRRATVDDLDTLKWLWSAMRLSPEELEPRLTEFQVIENPEGDVLGAIGIQFSGQHALLHSEGYSDFGVADTARHLFWERIQTLASSHGVFRIWTQERSPFWKSFGFVPPTAEILPRLPEEWKNEFDGGWLTFQLKNEDVINAALEKNLAPFRADGKKVNEKISEKARTLNLIFIIVGFAVFFACIAFVIYRLMHHPLEIPFKPPAE
jgi:hypothetical protein